MANEKPVNCRRDIHLRKSPTQTHLISYEAFFFNHAVLTKD